MNRNCKGLGLALSVAVVLLTGCGPSLPTAYPVTGEVRIDGEPAAGVELVFYAESPPPDELGVPVPRAHTDASGRYEVSTYTGGDGAPAGGYSVSAIWMTEGPEGADPESFNTVDQLAGRYANPKTSGLTAEVNTGTNQLPPFELSSP